MQSYEKINYAVRPNKRTQRKMIFEALSHVIGRFSSKKYGYVGFGSMWFSDFLYAHRRLRLTSLTSIERSEGYRRAVFNRPFRCVRVVEGDSSEVLPKLKWKNATIVWLDYDFQPELDSLGDVSFLAGNLVSGSVLMVTYDARPPWGQAAGSEEKTASLVKTFGEPARSVWRNRSKIAKRYGATSDIADLFPYLLVHLLWMFCKDLLIQNGRAAAEGLACYPLFSFYYKDGAPMVTLGLALVDAKDRATLDSAPLQSEFHFLTGETLFPIAVPPLTPKERAALDLCLPSRTPRPSFPLDAEQIRAYANLYQYYPLLAEVDL
ncbi:MAG TPA: O-methyltransferase [Candidatus Binatia bacterium]|jgi:hypothetical protein